MSQISDRAGRTFGDIRCTSGGANPDVFPALANLFSRPHFLLNLLVLVGSGLRTRRRSRRGLTGSCRSRPRHK